MFADDHQELHPTPLFARRHWTDLGGPWRFVNDDADQGLEESWSRRQDVFDRIINVPFPPESTASGICDPSMHPVVWYRRTFDGPLPSGAGRLILHFGAVDYRADVWINGNHVAEHEGGHTPFLADITPFLVADSEQVIVVRAADMPRDLSQPRGKQDWRETPREIWYNRTTGIWQPVWLEVVSPTHITGIEWAPDLDRAVLGVLVRLKREVHRNIRIRIRLSLRGQLLAEDLVSVYGAEIRREIALDVGSLSLDRHLVLWAPEHPNLIDAELAVLDGDEVLDEVRSYAGLRSVSTAGSRFLLNGRPYYLRMVLEQGYWPESHLAAPNSVALRREVELAREMGFNALRVHQKVEDPRFLYWCDRLGMMVWGEMANAYVFSRRSAERLTREWMDVVHRDLSHPCIVAWVPLNESWGVPNLQRDPAQQHFVRSLYHLTKALDPTRPVIANDGWEYIVGDIFGIHDYTFSGETIRDRYGTTERAERTIREVQPGHRFVNLGDKLEPNQPIMLTEFGGISLRPSDGSPWYGYGSVADYQSFLQKYRELVESVLDCSPISGFCYTQLTDTEQENNGLLNANRQPKIAPEILHSINSRYSAAVAGDAISQLQEAQPATFAGTSPEGDTSQT